MVLGVDIEGNKDILSITIGTNDSSKFWLGMLNDLKKSLQILNQFIKHQQRKVHCQS